MVDSPPTDVEFCTSHYKHVTIWQKICRNVLQLDLITAHHKQVCFKLLHWRLKICQFIKVVNNLSPG